MARKRTNSDVKETCPQCGEENFSISKDPSQKRFCMSCGKVWLPMTMAELELKEARKEIARLTERIAELEMREEKPLKDETDAELFS